MLEPQAARLHRLRGPVLALAAAHLAGLVVGAILVHASEPHALAMRDQIVRAAATDPASIALGAGDRWRAAAWDFVRNAFVGGATLAVSGLGVVFPFVISAYRGFVGGIVSVDSQHDSRLASLGPATYFVVVVALQLTGYTLAGAGGLQAGLEAWRSRRDPEVRRFLTIPVSGLQDMLISFVASLPFFAAGALVEFLAA